MEHDDSSVGSEHEDSQVRFFVFTLTDVINEKRNQVADKQSKQSELQAAVHRRLGGEAGELVFPPFSKKEYDKCPMNQTKNSVMNGKKGDGEKLFQQNACGGRLRTWWMDDDHSNDIEKTNN